VAYAPVTVAALTRLIYSRNTAAIAIIMWLSTAFKFMRPSKQGPPLDPVKARSLPPQEPPGDGSSTASALFRFWLFY
jgi:hypothetical protein